MKFLELKIIPPFQVLILGFLAWSVHHRLPWFHHHTGHEYLVSRILLLVALAMVVVAVYQFWRHKTTVNPVKLGETRALITDGIFSWSRNPIYLADVLILLAWVIWLGNWLALILIPTFVLLITRLQILPEERMLAEKFPLEFRQYTARTGRWLGRSS